jgi:diguanylate cyclase (GGDEF)-like protein/PAS domain S-box-containing protein
MYEELQQHAVKLRLEVAERERAERELLKFRAAVDQSTDGIFLIDPATSRILDSNRTAYEKLGYSREELLTCGVTDFEVELPEHFQWDEHVREVRAAGRLTFNGCHRRKDGSTYPVEVSIRYIAAASGDLMIAVVRDVTERRERERTILHLSRMHAVLSGINTLIVRERSREVLFREACRIAVDVGGFKLAWIGLIENDVLRPVAMQGDDGGHLAQLRINITSAEPGECEPTTLAMRDGQPHGSQDVAGDPGLADWRETLLALGIRSFVALPLKVAGRLAGCINLYAGDAGFFDEAEMTLLAELAGDIAYAMEFIVQKEESDYLAYYDPLTGLANRRLFLERVEEYLDAARRIKRLVAVGLLNLDNFRSINSSLGQAAGDELLKAVAGRLTRVAGSPNFLARIVADQYAVVMPNLEDVTDLAQVLKDSLIKRLSRPVPIESQEVRISGKGGFAVFPGDGEDAETLLRNAESALKNAKRSGESVVFYTERMGKALSERLGLENQMRRAFEQHEFVLHYQPKVDLRSGGICGAEALIRWNSPELGLVPPVKFIPLLEDTGMIVEVGRWALQQAVEDRRRWQASGLSAPRIAVNVSPLQMKQPDFVEVVCASVVTSAERAPGIDLEVTESMLMGDIETAIARLGALREKGINTAIDDFGTGYSSLAYLARLPVAAVKIDRSFVIKMAENADTMAIVSTIITLAHSMNLKVVAEGVDSPEQLKFLRLLKCDEIQGYLFSKPLPADEFAALLKEGRRLA